MRQDAGFEDSSAHGQMVVGVKRGEAPWVTPYLSQLGTVAQVTAKVDNVGRTDGGTWPTRRT